MSVLRPHGRICVSAVRPSTRIPYCVGRIEAARTNLETVREVVLLAQEDVPGDKHLVIVSHNSQHYSNGKFITFKLIKVDALICYPAYLSICNEK